MCLNQPRQRNGRFSSPSPLRSILSAGSNTAILPTLATRTVDINQAPATLRRGSLYRIVGGSVARYRGTVAGLDVFTVHGKPVMPVKRDRVRLADHDDVTAYLAND